MFLCLLKLHYLNHFYVCSNFTSVLLLHLHQNCFCVYDLILFPHNFYVLHYCIFALASLMHLFQLHSYIYYSTINMFKYILDLIWFHSFLDWYFPFPFALYKPIKVSSSCLILLGKVLTFYHYCYYYCCLFVCLICFVVFIIVWTICTWWSTFVSFYACFWLLNMFLFWFFCMLISEHVYYLLCAKYL